MQTNKQTNKQNKENKWTKQLNDIVQTDNQNKKTVTRTNYDCRLVRISQKMYVYNSTFKWDHDGVQKVTLKD